MNPKKKRTVLIALAVVCCLTLCAVLTVKKNGKRIREAYYGKLAAVSVRRNGWKKNETPVALQNENGVTYFDANVITLSDGTYRMYVSDRGEGAIACFDSADGEQWGEKRFCLYADESSGWEEIINRSCVIQKDDDYVMYYTGQQNGRSAIGMAKSEDGVVFVRCDGPVMTPEKEYEKDSVMNPYVIYREDLGAYYMYYAAGETYEPNVLCVATSADGYVWEKAEAPVLEARTFLRADCDRVGACEVYPSEEGYVMYYIGYSDINTARICRAVSADGIHFNRELLNVIVAPTPGTSDASACYKPTVIMKKDGGLRLFYNGRNGGFECILSADFD